MATAPATRPRYLPVRRLRAECATPGVKIGGRNASSVCPASHERVSGRRAGAARRRPAAGDARRETGRPARWRSGYVSPRSSKPSPGAWPRAYHLPGRKPRCVSQTAESSFAGDDLMDRRELMAAATVTGLTALAAAEEKDAPVKGRDPLKITRLETFLVQPRWLFLKVHTNAKIVGLGEPVVEGRAETVQTAVKEIEPSPIGKDPRQVVPHWQAIYRHAFYRGGPVLTSALSGIDMALWDIKGKALGVPVYELLGGPTRSKVRVYAHVRTAADVRKARAAGFNVFK